MNKKTEEQYQAEYDDLEAQERSLEIRRADEEEEFVRRQYAKENTDDICNQINQTDREIAKVRREMELVSDEAGWNEEEEDDELFYAEQAGWVEGQSN